MVFWSPTFSALFFKIELEIGLTWNSGSNPPAFPKLWRNSDPDLGQNPNILTMAYFWLQLYPTTCCNLATYVYSFQILDDGVWHMSQWQWPAWNGPLFWNLMWFSQDFMMDIVCWILKLLKSFIPNYISWLRIFGLEYTMYYIISGWLPNLFSASLQQIMWYQMMGHKSPVWIQALNSPSPLKF